MRRLPATILPVLALASLGAGAIGLSGCGSDDDAAPATTAAAAAEGDGESEYAIVDEATVTAGLTKLPATIESAIGAIGTPSADASLAAIESEWYAFEGTIRQNDRDLYLAMEDQLSPLQEQIAGGDADSAKATAETLNGLFAQYLAKFP
jgi:hypothetical protein